MEIHHSALIGGIPASSYCHPHKPSLPVLLTSCLLFAGLSFQASAQTIEPKSRDRIIFEPQIISITPSEAYSKYEEYRKSIGDNPVLDEAGIIYTPERAVYVNQLERYEEQANQLVIDEGTYSEGLINTYMAMANIYEKNAQLDLAFDAYDSAGQLMRIEHGLDTEMQLPVLKALADLHREKGDILAAREEIEKIQDLQHKLSDGSIGSSVTIDLNYATNLYELAEYAYYHNSADPEAIINALLTAKSGFDKASRFLSFDEKNNQEPLNKLRAQIVKTHYLIKNILDGSEISLVRINGIYFDVNEKNIDSTDTKQLFISKMNVADWSLISGLNYKEEAMQVYDEAYLLVKDSALENKEALIDEYFNQEIPTQIPTFMPVDYSLEGYGASNSDPRTTLGFVDVIFRLDRNGHAKRVKTQFRSPGLAKEYEEMLIEDIQRNQYRPAFEGSKPVRKNYSLRYYVSELN